MVENQINLFSVEDIYKHLDKQEPIDFTKVYDPLHFWDTYADKYYREFKKPQEYSRYVPWLLNKFKLIKIDTLYDAGCGFARVEPFLLQSGLVKDITAADISPKLLEIAKEYLTPKLPDAPVKDKFLNEEEFKLAQEEYDKMVEECNKLSEYNKHINVINQTIKWSNIKSDSFDCTMSIECMQHLHLPTARYAIKELKKLTKRYIIVIERFIFDGEHPAPHLWSHNYTKLFTDLGVKVLEASVIANGVIGLVLEK